MLNEMINGQWLMAKKGKGETNPRALSLNPFMKGFNERARGFVSPLPFFAINHCPLIISLSIYSFRRLWMGFAWAARTDCPPIVKMAMASARAPETAKITQVISM